MPRLSSPAAHLEPHYEVVIIGSGYGGAVMAARLAQAGFKVCVLERGAEYQPGDYPKTAAQFTANTQLELRGRRLGKSDAMVRFVVDEDHGALVGCGLGGTSLINAGVVLRPPESVWSQPRWPKGLRDDLPRLMNGFARAEAELQPVVMPREGHKATALREAAAQRGESTSRAPVAVNLGADPTRPTCDSCGNCITGCNRGAKNTLLVNYLPAAVAAGASLFCSVDVRHLERTADAWRVHFQLGGVDREKFETTSLTVDARFVVLSAGALGSPELLLRSRERGLPVSARLGKQWSGNGTILGFTVGADRAPTSEAPGPSIESMLDLRDDPNPARRMVIQDTALPEVLAPAAAALLRQGTTAARRMMTWSVTAGDEAEGTLELEDGRLRVRWPGAGKSARVGAVHAELSDLSRRLGGELRPNPMWAALPGKPLMATHPLGGCAFGDDASTGVVNHQGQVFDSDFGDSVHEGLYVCDGSTLPGSFDTNPLLTLSALAERCAELLVNAHSPRLARRPARWAAHTTGLRFTERMEGFLSPTAKDGVLQRPADATPLSFLLTVEWPDVDALLEDPGLKAATVGTLRAPSLAPQPLSVTGGQFQLFTGDGLERRMLHHMQLVGADRPLWLTGYKVIRDDPGPDLWHDTRTLFVSVRDEEKVIARGVVQTHPLDLLKQVTTIRGVGAKGLRELEARAKFLKLFLGTVRDVYGGLFLPLVR